MRQHESNKYCIEFTTDYKILAYIHISIIGKTVIIYKTQTNGSGSVNYQDRLMNYLKQCIYNQGPNSGKFKLVKAIKVTCANEWYQHNVMEPHGFIGDTLEV